MALKNKIEHKREAIHGLVHKFGKIARVHGKKNKFAGHHGDDIDMGANA